MVQTKEISLRTDGNCDIIDITDRVASELSRCSVNSGIVTVFVSGSTAGVSTIENEPGLTADFKAMWNRLVPTDMNYQHDRAWGEGNGYSHCRASILGASLTVPFNNKTMLLGTWQQIVLVDFDNRPRSRRLLLQIVGD